MYGKELILDLHNCNQSKFNREEITNFFRDVCSETGMKGEDIYFWDDLDVSKDEIQTNPQTKGTTGIQFILTSNITIHTLDLLYQVHINFFSCKDFEPYIVEQLALARFGGVIRNSITLTRV